MSRLIALAMIVMFLPATALADNVTKGQRIAKLKCAGCHGATGAGDGALLQTLGAPVPPVPRSTRPGWRNSPISKSPTLIEHGGTGAQRVAADARF